jgi:hypothetical protein
MEKKSVSKTFQKGDDYGELYEWFIKQIETHEWQPEGTDWSGGEPGPIDPHCDLAHKYIITVTRIDKSSITENTQPPK